MRMVSVFWISWENTGVKCAVRLKRLQDGLMGFFQSYTAAGKKPEAARILIICVKTKDWDTLAKHVSSIDTELLEELSHYTTEKAAKGLAKKHGLAVAKIYCALGMRILRIDCTHGEKK